MKKILFIASWFLSLIIVSLYTYENPESIEKIKHYYKSKKEPKVQIEITNTEKIKANSFSVEFSKVISLSEKTAFITHKENSKGVVKSYEKKANNILEEATISGYKIVSKKVMKEKNGWRTMVLLEYKLL